MVIASWQSHSHNYVVHSFLEIKIGCFHITSVSLSSWLFQPYFYACSTVV